MRKQDFLLLLIQSLNPNEKRYFKLFSSIQPGEKDYLRLFDALESKTVYDAAALSRELGITTAQLAEKKHYLNQAIFRCLRNLEESGTDSQEEHLVDIGRMDAQVLMSRGLFEHALDIIERAAAKAVELEMFETAINLLSKKWVCQFNLELFDNIEDTFDERERIINIQAELSEMFRLGAITAGLERKRAGVKDFEKILQHPLLKKKPESLTSLKAQVQWFEIKWRCYSAGGFDPSYGLNIVRMQWKHFEKRPDIQKLAQLAWLMSYSNLANAELEAGNALKALPLLKQLAQLVNARGITLPRATISAIKGHLEVFQIEVLFKLQRFKEVIAAAESVRAIIEQRPVYEQFMVLFYEAMAYSHLKQSDVALVKLNELLQLNAEERSDMQNYIRPAMILCQLDLGNYQGVPYLVKSSKAWMKRKKSTSPEVELFFSLTYAIGTAPETLRKQRWLKLQEAVESGKMKGMDREVNLKHWLQRKLAR